MRQLWAQVMKDSITCVIHVKIHEEKWLILETVFDIEAVEETAIPLISSDFDLIYWNKLWDSL